MARVSIDGPDTERLLEQLPIELRTRGLSAALRAAAVPVRRVARRLAPRQGSEDPRPDRPALVETIKTVIRDYGDRKLAVTGTSWPAGAHGHLVESGHDVVVSRGSRAGSAPLSGDRRAEAKAFLAPAVDQTQAEQTAALKSKLQQHIEKVKA